MIGALLLTVLGILAPLAASAEPYPRAALADGDVLRGRFVQERHLQGFAAPLRSEGRFVLAPGRGLIWQTEKPFAVTTIITAAGLAQEVNGTKTLSLAATKMPFLARLYDMLGGALTGDWTALDQDFAVTRGGGAQNWTAELLPRRADNPAMPFRSIAVAGDRFVNEVTLTKLDGDFDRLTFSQHAVSSAPLAADEAGLLDSLAR